MDRIVPSERSCDKQRTEKRSPWKHQKMYNIDDSSKGEIIYTLNANKNKTTNQFRKYQI